MNLSQFDLNLLVALEALLNDRNVTRAGSRLNLSQPAMSGALARLRRFFGDELLIDVSRKEMALTPLAENLIEPVHRVLAEIREAIACKRLFDPATSIRHFSIVASDYVGEVFLPSALREVARLAPGITFEVRDMGETDLADFESGVADFRICPDFVAGPAFPKQALFEDQYCCIAWTGNTALKNSVSLDQLRKMGHVVHQVGKGKSRNYLSDWFLTHLGFKRKAEVLAASFALVPRFVVGTNRIAVVPTKLSAIYYDKLELKILKLPSESYPIVETLQWHEERQNDLAHIWIRETFYKTAKDLALPGLATKSRKRKRQGN